jgi:hypothetical protein
MRSFQLETTGAQKDTESAAAAARMTRAEKAKRVLAQTLLLFLQAGALLLLCGEAPFIAVGTAALSVAYDFSGGGLKTNPSPAPADNIFAIARVLLLAAAMIG